MVFTTFSAIECVWVYGGYNWWPLVKWSIRLASIFPGHQTICECAFDWEAHKPGPNSHAVRLSCGMGSPALSTSTRSEVCPLLRDRRTQVGKLIFTHLPKLSDNWWGRAGSRYLIRVNYSDQFSEPMAFFAILRPHRASSSQMQQMRPQ